MSQLLNRLGRHAATHPSRTVGAWVLPAVVVVAAVGTGGSAAGTGGA